MDWLNEWMIKSLIKPAVLEELSWQPDNSFDQFQDHVDNPVYLTKSDSGLTAKWNRWMSSLVLLRWGTIQKLCWRFCGFSHCPKGFPVSFSSLVVLCVLCTDICHRVGSWWPGCLLCCGRCPPILHTIQPEASSTSPIPLTRGKSTPRDGSSGKVASMMGVKCFRVYPGLNVA